MKNLKNFTKADWYGWAGAERFANGSEPLIAWVKVASWPEPNVTEVAVIVDGNGVSVTGENGWFQSPSFTLSTVKENEVANIELGEELTRRLIDAGNLKDRGFEAVNFDLSAAPITSSQVR